MRMYAEYFRFRPNSNLIDGKIASNILWFTVGEVEMGVRSFTTDCDEGEIREVIENQLSNL